MAKTNGEQRFLAAVYIADGYPQYENPILSASLALSHLFRIRSPLHLAHRVVPISRSHSSWLAL